MKAEDFFGADAAKHWSAAWDHLHKFAHRTEAMPGDDVVKHFLKQREAFMRAIESKRNAQQQAETLNER